MDFSGLELRIDCSGEHWSHWFRNRANHEIRFDSRKPQNVNSISTIICIIRLIFKSVLVPLIIKVINV